MVNNLFKQKAPGPHVFTGELLQIFKEEMLLILLNNLFSENRSRENTPVPKPKLLQKLQKNCRPIFLMIILAKILNNVLGIESSNV